MRISTKGLIKAYKGRRVVNDVSFDFGQGEVVGLLGPNGAGKTTTFYMITGLVRPNQGKVFFDEEDVTRWPMYKRARVGVGYLPQETSVFRKLTVEDNIRLVLELVGVPGSQHKERVHELAEELHITRLLGSQANVLSGGERRRVEIARALAARPKFILLDEPFTGIDPVTIEEIQAIIARLKTQNIGILITDHNVGATLKITDRNYILIDGQIEAKGTGSEIASDERVRKFYLGQSFRHDDEEEPVEPEPEPEAEQEPTNESDRDDDGPTAEEGR